MNVTPSRISDVLLIEPRRFKDDRGWFMESYQSARYSGHGVAPFRQDSVSWSRHHVLRGLHCQHPHAQGKLVTCLHGAVWDVAVDLRRDSATFGSHVGHTLSGANGHQLWIPEGFAHAFLVLSEVALFHYKCTASYDPRCQISIRWDDPDLNIPWPVQSPILSAKDADAPCFADVVASIGI